MPIEFARKPKWLPGFVFVAAGSGLCLAALMVGKSTHEFMSRAAVANGVVIDASKGANHPLIEFGLPSGERHTFATGGFISGYRKGREVRVLYEPAAPLQSARLDDPGALWFGTRITGTLGAGLLLVGLLAMFVRSKDQTEEV